jgi:peptidoglycan/LPS O-acetylase OafA/YrhL
LRTRVAGDTGEFNVAAHGLRGLASLMVLCAHIIGGTARHVYPGNADYVALIQHPWVFGTFGVEIFFVISGYVILASVMKYDVREFAWRRFVRIYPLFFVLSLVFVALNGLTNAYGHLNNAKAIVAGLLFVNLFTGTEQLTPNAWSLSFEVWFYALTAFVVTCAVRRRGSILGGASIGAACGFLICFPITIYFLIGILMRLIALHVKQASPLSRTIEALVLILLIWAASREHHDYTQWAQFGDPVVLLIIVSLGLFFAMALMKDSLTSRALGNAVFRYLGTVSYSLYLVHPFTYYCTRLLFLKLGWFTDDVAVSMTLFATVVLVSSLLVTHVVHIALERWPYQRIFHQRVYRTKPAGGSDR